MTASFRSRFVQNLKQASKLAAVLAAVSVFRGMVLGRGFVSALVETAVLYAIVFPPAVLAYTAMSRFKSKGRWAHYTVWALTALAAWLPVFLLTRYAAVLSDPTGAFVRWPTFLLLVIMASLIWASIDESINARRAAEPGSAHHRGSA